MKILVLVNSTTNIFNNDYISSCITRAEFFANQFVQQVKLSNKDIDIKMDKCYMSLQNSKQTIYTNNFDKVDHIIYFNNTGLYGASADFINKLRLACDTLSVVAKGYKYKTSEDFIFRWLDPKPQYDQSLYINPPCDKLIYQPLKDKDTLYILLQKPEQCLTTKSINSAKKIISQIAELDIKDQNISLALINSNSIDIIDLNFNIISEKQFESYLDYIYEIKKANLYIVTSQHTDEYTFQECQTASTLVIAETKYVLYTDSTYIIKYRNQIDFTKIFQSLNTQQIKIYDKDIQLYESQWNSLIETVLNTLNNISSTQLKREINLNIQCTQNMSNKCYLNIHNRQKPNIILQAELDHNAKHASSLKPQLNAKSIHDSRITSNKKKHVYLQR